MIPIKPSNVTWTDDQWNAMYLSGSNIIVSAGAGSGKTAVLTKRIIEKIKSGISIRNMIVLTFTNAAAKEMKDRVKKSLTDLLGEHPEYRHELDILEQADITTFDAYSLSILKKYHYLLNIGSNISIIDEVVLSLIKEKYLDEIIEEEYENADFLRLLDLYTTKDDQSIKKAILSIYDKMDSICKKNEYLDSFIDEYYSEGFIESKIDEYLKLIEDTRNTISSIYGIIKNTISNPALEEKFLEFEENLENMNYAKNYDDYKKYINLLVIPTMTKNKNIEQDDIDEIKAYVEKLRSYKEDLVELLKYESIDEIKSDLYSTKDNAVVFIRIIKELDKRVLDYKIKNNVYEFSDITRLSIKILEEHSDIKESIKNNTHEIMIDEYQDTNDIGDYFISLISNNNVYMVGDVKQSIYKFRNANPKIFMEKYNKYKNHEDGEAIDLVKNFRSRKEVLEGINLIFNHIMDEEIGGANYSDGHNMVFGNNAYEEQGKTSQNYDLELLNYDYKNTDNKKLYSQDEVEAFIIANDIKNRVNNKDKIFDKDSKALRNVSYKDFVIIIDRKSNFELYKKVFEYVGIPLVVHKDEEFVYSNEIYVVRNLLKLIDVVKNNKFSELAYPFISVARSYVCKFSDNDIFKSVTENNILNNPVFSELFDKIIKLVLFSKENSLSSLVLELYKEFNLYEKSILIGNVNSVNKKLDYIYDVVCNLEKMGYHLEEFIEYFDSLFEKKLDIKFSDKTETEDSAVHIMSVHYSKGLEYPICYFPTLYKKFNKKELNDRFLFNRNYGIVMPVFKEGLTSTIYKRLLIDDYTKEEIAEKLRVFYVALTRAKEKMIIVYPINEQEIVNFDFNNGLVNNLERMKYTSLGSVMNSLKEVLKPYVNTVKYEVDRNYLLTKNVNYKEKLEKLDFKYITDKLSIDKKKIDTKNYSHSINKIEKENKTELGLDVHEVLEYLDFKNYKEDLNNCDISDYFKNKILKLFECSFMNNILKVHKEYEFYTDDSHGIIDLLIEKENEFVIVDYKLKDIDKDYYVDQVKGYINYLNTITDKKVIGYLYSIIDEKYKEITIDEI